VRAAHPSADVEVWASDEQRLGLKPILRPMWARRGQRPIARVQHRFQWLSLLAFVHPASGRSEWQFASSINTAVMSVALQAFARAVGAGPAKRVVLVLDQAG
jgi:DDE superfamily endonuclease